MKQARGMCLVRSSAHRSAWGFTLIELVVTLAVVAVLLTVGMPSFQSVINSNRVIGATNEMLAVFQQARLESVRLNQRVDVCPSTNGTSCAANAPWTSVIARAADGTIVRNTTFSPRLQVTPSSNISGAGGNVISFRPDGFARTGSGVNAARLTGRISICTPTTRPPENARHLVLAGARVSVDPPVTSPTCTAPAAP